MKKNNLMKVIAIALFAIMLFGLGNRSYSNNVTITNVGLVNADVTFTLTWDNSWRNVSTANSTMNYDGVWLFVKYRDACDKTSNYPSSYIHMWLVNDSAQQTLTGNNVQLLKTLGVSTVSGTTRALGMYVFRKYDGTGSISTNVDMKWDQASQGTTGGNWDIRVNAIEMVWIPGGGNQSLGTPQPNAAGGNFRIGGGNQTINSTSYTSYNFATNSTGLVPFTITAENASINFQPSTYVSPSLWTYGYQSNNNNQVIPATFPKGYDAFWVMKYEITQGQYCDFLNALDRQTQINCTYIGRNNFGNFNQLTATSLNNDAYRWVMYDWTVSGNVLNPYRQFVRCPVSGWTSNGPIVFGCDATNDQSLNGPGDGQNVAMNYLGYSYSSYPTYQNGEFLLKYLDWAALRPMDEFEFEKICRGMAAQVSYVSQEAVWGVSLTGNTSSQNPVGGIANGGLNNEGPSSPTIGTVIGEGNYGQAVSGPMRVGCFYGSNTTRQTAASSYYGVADMAGNVLEYCWSFGNHLDIGASWSSGGNYLNRNSNGDGDVLTTYNGSTNWPGPYEWTNGGGTTNWPWMWKGGCWYTNNTGNYERLSISWRGSSGFNQNTYGMMDGGRGVRTDCPQALCY